MDPSEYHASLGRPSPRREVQLQGPRPTPLKVRKDSYKIKKPPAAPGAGPSQSHHAPPPQQQQQQPPRAPVIIYTVSPKVIHTEPGNFMTLVQRLTGASPRTLAAAAAAPGPSSAANNPGSASPVGARGDLSPAARFAAMERGAQSSAPAERAATSCGDDIVEQLGIGDAATLDRTGTFPGILSPLPSALLPISPSFFSPPPAADPASLTFLNEMSPVFRATTGSSNINNSSFMDGPFLPSPGNFLSTPTLPSPGAFWEFFSQL